ncbi:MAG: hypothetical protein ACK5IJ_10245 [Mangrovibacterium sp.]
MQWKARRQGEGMRRGGMPARQKKRKEKGNIFRVMKKNGGKQYFRTIWKFIRINFVHLQKPTSRIMADYDKDALLYHENGRPGKIEVVPTKPYSTQRDLALAYSPGVAAPCLEIEKNPQDAYRYTAKGNLVAVISNGTAVLGLGNIGALAGKPVMEGKGLLFKTFADIDVFDIELDTEDLDKIIETVKIIAPTIGGSNMEEIKAPE